MFRFKAELNETSKENIRGGMGSAKQLQYVSPGEMPGVGFISCITLEPGASVGEHSHPDTGEFYLILDGQGEGVLDGTRRKVGPGDAFFLRAGHAHGLANTGLVPLKFLAVLTGGDSPGEDLLAALSADVMGKRLADGEILPLFLNRWSPRSFLPDPVKDEDFFACLEAARWAPSCFNEQPWRFIYARTPVDLERFCSSLSGFNRVWAKRAPVLVALCAKRVFTHNSSPNAHSWFDCGAAWMAFSLEAMRRGLSTHAMAGFDRESAGQAVSIPEGFEVVCFFALGKRGPDSDLPEEARKKEVPSGRNPRDSSAFEGRFPDRGGVPA